MGALLLLLLRLLRGQKERARKRAERTDPNSTGRDGFHVPRDQERRAPVEDPLRQQLIVVR